MKKILITLVLLSLNAEAALTVASCVATREDDQVAVAFVIEREANMQSVIFEGPVAWYDEVVNFNVLYSGTIGDKHLIVGRGASVHPEQMVEILFDAPRGRIEFKTGRLFAGDRTESGAAGKKRAYKVQCN